MPGGQPPGPPGGIFAKMKGRPGVKDLWLR